MFWGCWNHGIHTMHMRNYVPHGLRAWSSSGLSGHHYNHGVIHNDCRPSSYVWLWSGSGIWSRLESRMLFPCHGLLIASCGLKSGTCQSLSCQYEKSVLMVCPQRLMELNASRGLWGRMLLLRDQSTDVLIYAYILGFIILIIWVVGEKQAKKLITNYWHLLKTVPEFFRLIQYKIPLFIYLSSYNNKQICKPLY